MVGWLDSEIDGPQEDMRVYSLDKARARYEVREICADGWLVLNWDEDRFLLKFAVLHFYSSEMDDSNVRTQCVFHGEGPVGNLRECRHTWWGEDGEGYLFYPPGKVITSGLKALSEFYDRLL